MIKQQWLWLGILLLLAISLPGILNRWNVELNNNNYEIIIPYNEILEVEENSEKSLDNILTSLKEAGLTTVNFQPITLQELQKRNIISVYEEYELRSTLQFTEFRNDIDATRKGYYISVPENEQYQKLIEQTHPEIVTVAGNLFYFLPRSNGYDINTPIGYDPLAIDLVHSHDLLYTFKVENDENDKINDAIVQQLVSMKNDENVGILGSGSEILGFGQKKQNEYAKQLRDAGYTFYSIENNKLKGESTLALINDYDIIRLHSININNETNLTLADMVNRSVRAVKERNIKAIYYHIKLDGNVDENIDAAIQYISDVQKKMPSQFTLGKAHVFDKIHIPSWITLMVLIAGILFTYVASEIVNIRWMRVLATGFMTILAISYFVFDRIIFLQGFALIIAVITPIYAVIKAAETHSGNLIWQYVKAVAISFVGIAIIIGLLNGNAFITGYQAFRGVKFVYILPILGIVLYALYVFSKESKNGMKSFFSNTVSLLNKEVKFWHVLLFIFIAAIGAFYITRTGNFGSVSNAELTFRQWLEDTLYARPRTKEFLIGFPFFVLALYVMKFSKKWGSVLLVVGVIGFLSIVNTFTHLHIPIAISLLRTSYGVILGLMFGFIWIGILKVIDYFIKKAKLM